MVRKLTTGLQLITYLVRFEYRISDRRSRKCNSRRRVVACDLARLPQLQDICHILNTRGFSVLKTQFRIY